MPPVLIPEVSKMVLPDVGPVSVPIGEPVAHLKCFEAVVPKENRSRQVFGNVRRACGAVRFCRPNSVTS